MARAGGQIFRDVLRRKMNAKYDNPNYDDQGQEMETYDHPYADDEYDPGGGYQVKKPMRNPNPDGTFDGPSGGRPMQDVESGFNSKNPFLQATADAGGDEETMQAVLGAAEQMGMNGVPIEQMMAYDAELDEGGPDYVFKSPEERKAMLQEAYQRGQAKAQNQTNKNMG
ncbi:MAG: hypothetical protein RL317_909, partial [Pseudomonadota bacterium]